MSLYFNLEDNEDNLMWEHLNSRKKSQYIKRLILNDLNASKQHTSISEISITEEVVVEDSKGIKEEVVVEVDLEDELEVFPDELN